MFIRYGCQRRSILVILLNDERLMLMGFLHVVTCGCCSNVFRTSSMFSTVLTDLLLPEFPLLQFKLVPFRSYLITFLQIVVLLGGCRSGNCCMNASCTAWGLLVPHEGFLFHSTLSLQTRVVPLLVVPCCKVVSGVIFKTKALT